MKKHTSHTSLYCICDVRSGATRLSAVTKFSVIITTLSKSALLSRIPNSALRVPVKPHYVIKTELCNHIFTFTHPRFATETHSGFWLLHALKQFLMQKKYLIHPFIKKHIYKHLDSCHGNIVHLLSVSVRHKLGMRKLFRKTKEKVKLGHAV